MEDRTLSRAQLEAELIAARKRVAELEAGEAELSRGAAAQRESEARFRLLVESAPDAIFIQSEGRFAFVNQAALELLGAERSEDLLGTPIIDRIHPDFRDTVRARINVVNETGGKPPVIAERFLRLDGSSVDVEVSAVPVFFEGRNAAVVFVRDITGRKKAFDDLARVTDELTTIFDNVPATIWYKDTRNNFIRVNRSAASLVGLEVEDINGRSTEDIFPSEAAKYYADDLEVINSGLPKLGIVEKATARDGSPRWVSTDKLPVRDAQGNVTGVLAFAVDNTQRLRAENDLLESQKRLAGILSWKESIINSSAVGILVVTKNRLITEVNSGLLDMFGYTAEELVGQSVALLHVDQEKFREFGKRYWATTTKRKVVTTEWRMRRKNGEEFWCELTGSAINSRDIRHGVVWVVIDIDERKRLREAMIQSEKMMTVGGLAAGMAHEINNPLGGILQSLQNIKRRLSAELPANERIAREQGCSLETVRGYLRERQIFEFLDAIEEAGKRAARIVSHMQEFSRKGASASVPTDMNGLIDKAVALCSSIFDPQNPGDIHGIQIVRDYDPSGPAAPCIPSQIEQVLVNLIQNALHALNDRPPADEPARIVLRTRIDPDNVRIEVEDNGPGMEPDVLRRAFDPFFTTKPVGKGTGLGLSVSYFFVTNNHEGVMEAKSSAGHGACFIVKLPIRRRRTTGDDLPRPV